MVVWTERLPVAGRQTEVTQQQHRVGRRGPLWRVEPAVRRQAAGPRALGILPGEQAGAPALARDLSPLSLDGAFRRPNQVPRGLPANGRIPAGPSHFGRLLRNDAKTIDTIDLFRDNDISEHQADPYEKARQTGRSQCSYVAPPPRPPETGNQISHGRRAENKHQEMDCTEDPAEPIVKAHGSERREPPCLQHQSC